MVKDDIEKYQLIDRKVTMVVKAQSEILSDILPMHSKITLEMTDSQSLRATIKVAPTSTFTTTTLQGDSL